MSRSAEAKKRRNQAKNLKRKQKASQGVALAAPKLQKSEACNNWVLPVYGSDKPIELYEFWDDHGWFFVTTDHRMLRSERNLPVVVDSDNLDVCEIASWYAPVPHDCERIPVWVYEHSNGNWTFRHSFVQIHWSE